MIFDFLKKRDYAASIVPGGTRLTVKSGQRLLNAALDAGLDWPHDCRVGSCGTCRCVLKSGHIKALTDFVYTLDPEDLREGTILACQALLKSDVVVEVSLGNAATRSEEVGATIVEYRRLTHDIVEMTIELERSAFASARAGQYLDIRSPGLVAPRSYSLAHAPSGANGLRYAFFIRHVPGGEFTDWLFADDRIGAALTAHGPFGNFYRRQGSGRMICIAGGSGLAPVHAVLEDALRAGDARECLVLFGARAQRDLYYLDELAALGRRWAAKFTLFPVLSNEPADSAWCGARGLVTAHLAEALSPDNLGPADQAYLCGPPAMVDAAIARLNTMGMAPGAIYFDKFLDASTQPGGRDALR